MSLSGNIWIKPKKRIKFWGNSDVDRTETHLQNLFTNGYPVLLPSARTGLYLIFKLFLPSESVRVFPYASQCIVNAAFASGKSICTPKRNEDRDVFHRQWGYHDLEDNFSHYFIEDSADSFYPIGATVCRNGTRFEVWSLPKIIGSSNGGIVWCKNKTDAILLRNFINKMKPQNYIKESFLYLLKSKSKRIYRAWENYQFTHPKLNGLELKYLNYLISNWQFHYTHRLGTYLKFMKRYKGIGEQEITQWIELNYGVIPVVLKMPYKINGITVELHELLRNGQTGKINLVAYQKDIKI